MLCSKLVHVLLLLLDRLHNTQSGGLCRRQLSTLGACTTARKLKRNARQTKAWQCRRIYGNYDSDVTVKLTLATVTILAVVATVVTVGL
jgi:hypothetical protein